MITMTNPCAVNIPPRVCDMTLTARALTSIVSMLLTSRPCCTILCTSTGTCPYHTMGVLPSTQPVATVGCHTMPYMCADGDGCCRHCRAGHQRSAWGTRRKPVPTVWHISAPRLRLAGPARTRLHLPQGRQVPGRWCLDHLSTSSF